MHWIDWVIAALFALNSLATISAIGRPRTRIDHGTALWIVIINVALIVGLILTHT